MKVKEIKRAANIAWSPYHHESINIALGTAAQLIDATFSTESTLDIYDLNLSSSCLDLTLLGGVKSDYRFHKLLWGCAGIKSTEKSSGQIIGGTHDGSILIYDPEKIIKNEEDSCIYQMKKHTGPVHCLDLNKFQDCLLASGSSESEIFVWDLNNPSSPTVPQIKSQPSDCLTSVAWNCQVQHILASTFRSHCAVSDLRRNEPIMKITNDPLQMLQWKMLSWHPEAATQLCLASENDNRPVIQLYDLRYAQYPVHSLEGHDRGVLTMAWCPQDPELLFTSGKDNKILCWNPISGCKDNLLFSSRCSGQCSFDLSFCPRNPSYVATSSSDGNVGIFFPHQSNRWNFDGEAEWMSFGFRELGNVEFSSSYPKQPKWMRRTAGASFAFGGKLICFSRTLLHGCHTKVSVHMVTCEPEVVEQAAKLEHAINTGQMSSFCQNKSEASADNDMKIQWNFLKIILTGSAKERAMFLLGLDSHNHLKDSKRDDPEYRKISNSADESEVIEPSIDTNIDSMLSRALLVGNIELAVDICIDAKPQKWADALVLANVGGQELIKKTQKEYFNVTRKKTSRLISAIVSSDWLPFIENCAIESWKETLAALLIYSKPEEFSMLCEKFLSRLDSHKGFTKHNSTLCYIAAGNLERLAQLWAKDVKKGSYCLQDLIEQIVVLRYAIIQASGNSLWNPEIQSGTLSFLLNCFAALLSSQGYLRGAIMYLSCAKNEESCALFFDRITRASEGNSQSKAIPHANFTPVSHPQSTLQGNSGMDMQTGVDDLFSSRKSFGSTHQPPVSAINPQHIYVSQPPVFFPQAVPNSSDTSSSSQAPSVSSSWSPPKTGFVPKSSQRREHGAPISSVPSSMAHAPATSGIWSENEVYQYPASSIPPLSSAPVMTNSWTLPKTDYITNHSQKELSETSSLPHLQRYPKNLSGYSTLSKPSDGSQLYAYTTPYSNVYHQSDSFSGPASQPVNFYHANESGAGGFSGTQAATSYSNPTYLDYTFTQAPSASLPPESNVSSYQVPSSQRTLQTGWNDPPILKKTSAEHSAIAYQAPTPITTPLCGSIADSPYTNSVTFMQSCVETSAPHLLNTESSKEVHETIETVEECVPEMDKLEVKNPIPPEHKVIQDVFEFLQRHCQEKANTPQICRKLDEIPRKLENLYDLLRDQSLSNTVLDGLHKITRAVLYDKDYSKALRVHGEVVSNCNFGEICAFMPSVKILLQVCNQLGICMP